MNKTQIVEGLQNGIQTFSYVKANGEVRKACGTLDLAEMPALDGNIKTAASAKRSNDSVVNYFDMGVNSWRSFNVDNFGGFA